MPEGCQRFCRNRKPRPLAEPETGWALWVCFRLAPDGFFYAKGRVTMKRMIACLMVLTMLAGVLAGCGGKAQKENTESQSAAEATVSETTTDAGEKKAEEAAQAEENKSAETEAVVEDEEEADTGDASLDNPRNQDKIGDQELLVVSFGTSFNDNRRATIGAVEDALEKAFPEWSVRRAFTSQIIIDHVKSRDGEVIDNVTEALERAVANGVKELVVQPTHLMDGYEYNDLLDEVLRYADSFDKIKIGQPLLLTDDDFNAVADAIVAATSQYDDGETAIVFMGHGTEAESNGVYEKMQGVLDAKGMEHYFIGTVEAYPDLEQVLAAVKQGSYKRVVLRPLMVVAGDHANNDMAGDDKDSWKSVFEAEGYQVECVLEGLGSLEAIRQMYVSHAQDSINEL